MPYHLSENGLCVMDDDNKVVKCHDMHDDAVAHMRALMANVPDAKAMHPQAMHEMSAQAHAEAVEAGAECGDDCPMAMKAMKQHGGAHEGHGGAHGEGGGGGGEGSSGGGGSSAGSEGGGDRRRGAGTPARQQFDFLNKRLAAGNLKPGERTLLERRVEKLSQEIMGAPAEKAMKAMADTLRNQDMHDESASQHEQAVKAGAECDCMMSMKAGARHSTGDIAKGRGVKNKAREIVKDMEDLGFPDEHQVGNPGEVPTAKAGDLPEIVASLPHYASIKALPKRQLELKVAFGGPHSGKDGQGERFSNATDFDEDNFPNPPVTYYHGFDKNGRPTGKPIYIGKTVKHETRADGRYLLVELNSSKYADDAYNAAKNGRAVVSPGTVPHLTRPIPRRPDGHLDYWPIAEIATWELLPGHPPANPWSVASLPTLKSLYQEAGIHLPTPLDNAEPQATGAAGTSPMSAAGDAAVNSSVKGILDMDEKDLLKLLDDRDAANAARAKAAADAETARQTAEQTRIDAAVQAAEAKAKKDLDALKAQYVAGGRLQMGDPNVAPHQTRFADTVKYDGLSMGDLAFAAGILDAVKRKDPAHPGVSNAALKALAIKIAEDKTDIGAEGRGALKACGIEPADTLDAAKANEVQYATLSGFGDEWVPTVWSPTLWQTVRAMTFIFDKIPQKGFDGPGDTFEYPLEGADPTWYMIGETTDIDSTNRRPNATIGDSQVATDKKQATFKKVGARILFSGELVEDSIIPWIPQLRAQTERSFAEQMEHLVIDGDTETGATTNINHIGGTPTSTGTKRDLFLALNGFRKSCLVTTTANSRSGAGTIVDTDFLETVKLMGAAGMIGSDPTKVDFIVDPNTSWKVAQLASVKTRDVFLQATIENGLLKSIWSYKVFTSWFMHWRSTTNPRKANTAGKVDLTTQANNTTGSILAVRWDQWFLGYKRRMVMKLQDIPDSDAQQLIATARLGLTQRDTEGSSVTYNVGI